MSSRGRYKGQEALLKAFPTIHNRFPNSQLVLAGEGDDLLRLRALAGSLSPIAQSAVFMPGYVDDDLLDRLYRDCFLFVMPSEGEGFGLVYLEAMAHAKPCLGARLDATPSVIQDNVTGLLVDDPRAPAQIANGICWLLANPDDARRMGLAAYELVRSHHRFSHFRDRFWKGVADS
jgi:phosphatidylinositol alpha-1,6-mannosyltransferase